MKYKVNYDEKTQILHLDVLDRFDPQDVTALTSLLSNEFTTQQLRCLLANISEPAQAMPSKETRRALRDETTSITLDKIAICGAKPALRMVGRIVVTALGKAKQTRFFENKDEAVAWLKGERS